jgi:predicted lipoprotein
MKLSGLKKLRSRLPRSSVYLCFLFVLSACGERQNDAPLANAENLAVALEEAVNYSVLPAVTGFSTSANTLLTEANSFCALPSESALVVLQEAWRSLLGQWFRVASYKFGPLDEDLVSPTYIFIDSLRLRGTDYLATVRDEISSDMAGDDELNEAYFAGKTFQRVGLRALESAIFETAASDHSRDPAAIITEYQNNTRKCEILTGLAGQLQQRAAEVEAGWQLDYKDNGEDFRSLFLNGELEDGSEPLTLLLVSVQEYLDYLKARNVILYAGSLADSAWPAMAEMTSEVVVLLEGTEQTTVSFFGFMDGAGYQSVVTAVRETLAGLQQSIADQDSDALAVYLGRLDGHFKREIPDSLEVELGINFSDGD